MPNEEQALCDGWLQSIRDAHTRLGFQSPVFVGKAHVVTDADPLWFQLPDAEEASQTDVRAPK